jgi:hypothetical protein
MKTRMMRKIAVLVTGSALALSLPVASSVANSGGVPNDGHGHSKACENVDKSQGQGPKPNTHRKSDNGKGWKCGLSNAGLTLAT